MVQTYLQKGRNYETCKKAQTFQYKSFLVAKLFRNAVFSLKTDGLG